jgi:hypothetical protein
MDRRGRRGDKDVGGEYARQRLIRMATDR